jgi:ubiquinone biosynthesis protein UbiJ
MLPSKYGVADFPVDMQVVGDITLAQDFQKIMKNLDIDLEDPLSKWVGDTLAYQIGQFMRKAGNITFKTVETLMVDISEYLRFEIEMLPDELLVEEFSKEVDLLRNDTELVSKRIDRLDIYLANNK